MSDEVVIDNNQAPDGAPVQAAEQPAETAPKIVYSPEQQQHLEGLIREAQGRAAKELRAQLIQTQEALSAKEGELGLYQTGVSAELIEARQQLAAEKAARSAAEERQTAAERRALIKEEAMVAGMFNPGDAAYALAQNVTRKEGRFVVLDDEGEPRVNADGQPFTVSQLVREYTQSRPWAVRGDVKPGAGSTPSQGVPTTTVKMQDIFGPKSDGALAQKSSRSRLYAVQTPPISGAAGGLTLMLNSNSPLTPEQLAVDERGLFPGVTASQLFSKTLDPVLSARVFGRRPKLYRRLKAEWSYQCGRRETA